MRAIFSKGTTDNIKSKIKSTVLSELVIECYMSPAEFAYLLEKFDNKEFELVLEEIK